ncbi:hypothetical protein [Bacillus velezensis]|uniref:hypothetical protein n=1 Tax=Bacillus velezensis TaxID=492670 RepID=UPI0032561B23
MNHADNPIISAVISKLNAQQDKGLAKYGQPVQVNAYDLRGWLQHALEETLDLAVYLEAAIQNLDRKEETLQATYNNLKNNPPASESIEDMGDYYMNLNSAQAIYSTSFLLGFNLKKEGAE